MHPWTQASPTTLASRAVLIHPRIRRPRVGQLTDRERDVLDQLPSRRNLDEIADDLAVPVSTVTSDLRSIYGKLGSAPDARPCSQPTTGPPAAEAVSTAAAPGRRSRPSWPPGDSTW